MYLYLITMDVYRDYLPTKAYKRAEMRFAALLRAERDRLDRLVESKGRDYAIGPDNLREELPNILDFTKRYHEAFAEYLAAVLPQQPRPVQCRPACGNCCHHYPMSVEPFELIYLYCNLRKRDDLLEIMEACQARSSTFDRLYATRFETVGSEDEAEDLALHDYFAQWKPCPFSDKAGDCSIYPLRPVSCRMYFSETSPDFCKPEFLQTEKNESYIVYLPDVIEEALYGISELYSGLNLPESYFGGLLSMNMFEGILA